MKGHGDSEIFGIPDEHLLNKSAEIRRRAGKELATDCEWLSREGFASWKKKKVNISKKGLSVKYKWDSCFRSYSRKG